MKEFEGEIIFRGITVNQFLDALAIKVVELMEQKKETSHYEHLPELVSKKEAAALFAYKDRNSLNQFHGKGLTPIRKGRQTVYTREQVIQLYNTYFKLNF